VKYPQLCCGASNPLENFPPPSLRARGPSGLVARGKGRPFIPPAELGGILAYFDKKRGEIILWEAS